MFRKRILLCALMALCCALTMSARAEGAVVPRPEDLTTDYLRIETAKDALIAKYGHTRVTLGAHRTEVRPYSNGRTTVRFTPAKQIKGLGEYAVVLEAGRPSEASWTLEGQAGALGRAEIEAIVEGDRRFRLALNARAEEKGDSRAFRVEEWADLGSLLDPSSPWILMGGRPALPGPGDMRYAEALRLFKRAIGEKYGLPPEALNAYEDYGQFNVRGGSWYYDLMLAAEQGLPAASVDRFFGHIASEDLDVSYLYWQVSPTRRALPAGHLAAYPIAVEEYIAGGAIDALPHAERAALDERIFSETGLFAREDGMRYAAPQADFIPEAEAIETAKIAFVAECGMTDALFALYDVQTALLTAGADTAPFWQVRLFARADIAPYFWDAAELFGVYTASIDARQGFAISARRAYGESAPPTHSPSFPELVARTIDAAESARENPSQEEHFAIARDFEKAGYTRTSPNGEVVALAEGALSETEARALVTQTIVEKYGFAEDDLARALWSSWYSAEPFRPPTWHMIIGCTGPGLEDVFTLEMNALTGEMYRLEYFLSGNG